MLLITKLYSSSVFESNMKTEISYIQTHNILNIAYDGMVVIKCYNITNKFCPLRFKVMRLQCDHPVVA